jgi:hypothetical protein
VQKLAEFDIKRVSTPWQGSAANATDLLNPCLLHQHERSSPETDATCGRYCLCPCCTIVLQRRENCPAVRQARPDYLASPKPVVSSIAFHGFRRRIRLAIGDRGPGVRPAGVASTARLSNSLSAATISRQPEPARAGAGMVSSAWRRIGACRGCARAPALGRRQIGMAPPAPQS